MHFQRVLASTADETFNIADQIADFRLPLGDWTESGLLWIQENLGFIFRGLRTMFMWMYDAVHWLLYDAVHLLFGGFAGVALVIIIVAVLGLFARGRVFAVGSVIGLYFIYSVGQWENAMVSLALVIVATILAVLISLPLGIWAAKSDVVSAVVKPIMDFLQTLPAFVYLVPALALFRIGVAPAIVATLVFSLAPGVRLTELGIRGVNKEVVEAGEAFGSTPRRILRQIQIPLATPSIMAGINQIIMLALSMVVIAGMVGAGGLGGDVNSAIQTLDEGLGFEAGISVVVLAILLDRFTASFGQKKGLYAKIRARQKDKSAENEQKVRAIADADAEERAKQEAEELTAAGPRRQPGAAGM